MIFSVDGKQIKMSEDHRITSYSERLRINETGVPLREGETRLCGKGKIISSSMLPGIELIITPFSRPLIQA